MYAVEKSIRHQVHILNRTGKPVAYGNRNHYLLAKADGFANNTTRMPRTAIPCIIGNIRYLTQHYGSLTCTNTMAKTIPPHLTKTVPPRLRKKVRPAIWRTALSLGYVPVAAVQRGLSLT